MSGKRKFYGTAVRKTERVSHIFKEWIVNISDSKPIEKGLNIRYLVTNNKSKLLDYRITENNQLFNGYIKECALRNQIKM